MGMRHVCDNSRAACTRVKTRRARTQTLLLRKLSRAIPPRYEDILSLKNGIPLIPLLRFIYHRRGLKKKREKKRSAIDIIMLTIHCCAIMKLGEDKGRILLFCTETLQN